MLDEAGQRMRGSGGGRRGVFSSWLLVCMASSSVSVFFFCPFSVRGYFLIVIPFLGRWQKRWEWRAARGPEAVSLHTRSTVIIRFCTGRGLHILQLLGSVVFVLSEHVFILPRITTTLLPYYLLCLALGLFLCFCLLLCVQTLALYFPCFRVPARVHTVMAHLLPSTEYEYLTYIPPMYGVHIHIIHIAPDTLCISVEEIERGR